MRINCDVHDLALRSQVGCNHSPCCRGLGRAGGGEIHVRITTDSFVNPGGCVRPFLCALRNSSYDRMQKLLTWHSGHYALIHSFCFVVFAESWYREPLHRCDRFFSSGVFDSINWQSKFPTKPG